MLAFIIALHVLVSILLTVVILMQSSKGGGLAGAFGGQGSMGAVFGGRGAGSFLSKVTVVLAAIFMLGSIVQGLMQRGGTAPPKSLIQQEMQKEQSGSALDILPKLPGDQGMTGTSTPAPQSGSSSDTIK